VHFLHSILVNLTDLLISWPTGWTDLFTGIAELQSGRYVEKAFPKQMMEQFAGSRWKWMRDSWLTAFRETFGCNASVYPWIRYYDEIQAQVYPKTPTPVFRMWNYYSPLEIQVRKQKHLIGLSQAATYLGVDERQVVVLTAAGIIEAMHGPLFDESLVWLFDTDDLQRFLESFLAPIPLNLDSRPEKSELSIIVGITHVGQMLKDASISFARLFLDLQFDNLAVMRCNDVLSFQSLVFVQASIADYITRLRKTGDCTLVGMDEACTQLQCDHRLLRWWYGTGVLVPVREDIGFHEVCWQYSEADIRRVASYLNSEEAAQFLEVSIATLERWIWADQIPALKTPPWMALKNPAMFDKEELIAWRNARLTRGEAAKLLGLSSCAMTEWIRDAKVAPMEVMANGRQWFSRQAVEELAQELRSNLP
jgi:predicted site-specific integrase-resolvase